MPRNKPGMSQYPLVIEEWLKREMEEVASENHRSLNMEITSALEYWVEMHPITDEARPGRRGMSAEDLRRTLERRQVGRQPEPGAIDHPSLEAWPQGKDPSAQEKGG